MDQAEPTGRSVAKLGDSALRQTLPTQQRGWAGLVVILIALVLVALLAQKALKTYGVLPGAEPADRAGTRLPPAVSPAPGATATAPAAPANAIERARGLEPQLQRDAEERGKRIDEQTQ